MGDLTLSSCDPEFLTLSSFSRNTRAQLKQVVEALRELTTPPEPHKRPIGFVTPQDKPTPKAKAKAVGAAKKTAAVKAARKK